MLGRQIYSTFGFLTVCSIAFAQVGEKCVSKVTLEEGECKISSECPIVEEQSKLGVATTICGYHKFTIPIVCCPVDNKFNAADIIVYEEKLPQIVSNNNNNNKDLRISEQKCEEFYKNSTDVIQALPLVTNAEPTTFNVERCPFNSLPLIVGGKPASAGEFPFMTVIGFNTDEDKWRCGGTLISNRFVLTAAHCTFSIDAKGPTVVRLGDVNLKSKRSEFRDYEVLNIIVHPDYRPPKKYNDIALIKTKETIEFTKNIRPACLYTKETTDQKIGIATGWGKTDFAAENEEGILMKVTLNMYDNSLCAKAYKSGNEKTLPNGIISSMLCAGEIKGDKDTCQGDSGGPLLVTKHGNHCKFYIIGITSFGKSCGLINTPAIYTKVSQYVSWIEKNVWG